MILIKGIGTRIRTLVTGIALGETRIVWMNDGQCPVDAEDAFPNGLEGVELETVSAKAYIYRPRLRGPMVPRMQAWKRVWDAMPEATLTRYPCAIHFRGFHPGGKPWPAFSEDVRRFAESTEGDVFVMADSRRNEFREILGDRMVDPFAEPLSFDYDRQPDQVLAHLLDWRHFVLAGSAISSNPRAAATWARKFLANPT